jgi:hypothetical protein
MEPNFPDKTTDPRGFGKTPELPPEENEDGSVNATDEEQMQYDLLTVRARKMIFGPAKEEVLKVLGSSDTPAKGIGQAGAMLMKSLLMAAKNSGQQIGSEVAIEAGTEIADDLNELGKASGVFQYEDQEEEDMEMEDAMLWGVKFYGDGMVTSGEITPEIQKAAAQQTADSVAAEGAPKKKANPIGDAVGQAMQPKGGLISGQMPAAGGM